MSQPLLSGEIDNGEVDRLRGENFRLTEELTKAHREVDQARRAVAATVILRRQLEPLHRALLAIFGELDSVGMQDPSAGGIDNALPAVWQSWKQKLGGGPPSTCIDALFQHGSMSAVQLRVAMKCHINTVYLTTAKLQKLGLVNKSGGRYSLREI